MIWNKAQAQTKAQKPKTDLSSVCFFQEAYASFKDAYATQTLHLKAERLEVAYATLKLLTLLLRSVRNSEADPQNNLFSIPISISHVGKLTRVK